MALQSYQNAINHTTQAPASAMQVKAAYVHSDGRGGRGQVMLYQYTQLLHCTLHRRYKRFLADVYLNSSTSSPIIPSAVKEPITTAVSPAATASFESNKVATNGQPAKRRRRSPSCSLAASTAASLSSGASSAADTGAGGDSAVGATTVVHCPNTGSMMGLLDVLPAAAACSVSTVATRKYKHTLEMICIPVSATAFASHTSSSGQASDQTAQHTWTGVHSALANKLVKEMLTKRLLPQLGQYNSIQPEVKHNTSRFDFLLTRVDQQKVYVEVKSITMAMPCSEYASLQNASLAPRITQKECAADAVKEAAACNAAATAAATATATGGLGPHIPADGMIALFPDAVSDRAQRHVQELTQLRSAGHEAVCIFAIQRRDCSCFAPAAHIDPSYATAVKTAVAAGVQMIAVVCEPDPENSCIWFRGCVPVLC